MLSASFVVAMARRTSSSSRRALSRRSAAATAAACVALSSARSASGAAAASFAVSGGGGAAAAASGTSSPAVGGGVAAAFLPAFIDGGRGRTFASQVVVGGASGAKALYMSAAAVAEGEAVTEVSAASTDVEGMNRPVASGPVLRFSPGSGGLGGVAAVRLREGDVPTAAAAAVAGDSAAPGMFGKPKGYESGGKAAQKKSDAKKGDDFVGRSVLFPDGRSGVVVAERPPIAFVLCDFDSLDEAGEGKDGKPTYGDASVLDSMATVEASDALLGKVLDWRGRELTVAEDGSVAASSDDGAVADATVDGKHRRAIFAPIPKVSDIALINEPMLTGSAVVDALAPLGKGQNMLLMGQEGTGKSALAVGAVAAQIRAARDEARREGKRGVRCVYGVTSSDPADRAEVLKRLEEAGVRDDVVVVSTRGAPSSAAEDDGDNELRSAEAVAVAATACAVGEAFALAEGYDSLVIVDDIDRHKALWDWTTRVLVDVYGVDAVVKDDRDGGASSEMRGYYSSLIQRAGKYNAYNGGGSVTLMMLASVPGAKVGGDEEDVTFSPEDFDGASQKVKDRIDILVKKGIPLTPATLRKIQIPVPTDASESENARRLALQHADDLISMSDGQIWLDADLLNKEGRTPPIDPQRSITRVGIGADTESRADAPAVRGLTGGLRFELAQAVDSMAGGSAATKADEKQIVRRDAWLLAMHQKCGDVRDLSENVAALLAAKIGELDDVVRGGAKAGTKEGDAAIAGMIDFVRTSAPAAMDEVDNTDDLSEGAREALEEAIRSYFETYSSA